jgi:hypothetical protein
LLANKVMAIQAAVSHIEAWYMFEIQPMLSAGTSEDGDSRVPEEMPGAFKVVFEGCRLTMDSLREEMDRLMSKTNPFAQRPSVLWKEATMKDFAERFQNQVNSLQLLTDTVKL